MLSDDIILSVSNLSKVYPIYPTPRHRLYQAILPKIQRKLGLPEQQYCQQFHALENVSFSLKRGETFGIVGRNGAGKSTLLQLIAGTVQPSSGSIQVFGRVAALLELGSGFDPELTGRENVFLNATILGLTNKEIERVYPEILDFSGIGDFIDRPVKTYSSGMQVRLAFAVTVFVEPDLLIVDEALAVGDAAFQFKCLKRIEDMQKRGVSLLFVSHDMQLVQNFCQNAIYLEKGRVKSEGSAIKVAGDYAHDNRELHRQAWASNTPTLKKLESIANTGDVSSAFGDGTEQIVSATFVSSNAPVDSFTYRQPIDIKITLSINSLKDLYLVVMIQNTRLLDISGFRFALDSFFNDVNQLMSTIIKIDNKFLPGNYFITLRLVRHVGMQEYATVLVQRGVMQFTIASEGSDNQFLGMVATNMELLIE